MPSLCDYVNEYLYRVLCPPGGGGSLNIFGGSSDSPPANNKRQSVKQATPLQTPPPRPQASTTTSQSPPSQVATSPSIVPMGTGSTKCTSTKVHAPPGGGGSLNIFGGNSDSPPASNMPQSVKQAPPSQANTMTPQSTQAPSSQAATSPSIVPMGTGSTKRTSTKVHAPPGGGGSLNIFGGNSDSPPASNTPQSVKQATPSQPKQAPLQASTRTSQSTQAPSCQAATSPSIVPMATKHTSTKVHAPPGGKSNFSFY